MTEPLWTGTEWTNRKLERVYKAISDIAIEELKLDPYPAQLEIITSEQMVDAYTSIGMPIFYHHWSFGKHFTAQWTQYQQGLMGLAYEIVINSDPCIAYLMEENTMTMQALTIAHASFGHSHFFKNNCQFQQWTDAGSIVDYLVFAREYIKRCEVREGNAEVEHLLDACHAMMNYGINRAKRPAKKSLTKERQRSDARDDYQQSQITELTEFYKSLQSVTPGVATMSFPREPEENILYFCEKYAPDLPVWKREIIRIVRKISQYFYPQGLTKVINEGCLIAGSLIETSDGLIPIEQIVQDRKVTAVWDGSAWRKVYDWFEHAPKRRIKLVTHHGYEVHGGSDHKLLINGEWKTLDNIEIGDELPIAYEHAVFAQDYADLPPVQWALRPTEREIAEATGLRPGYYHSVSATDRRDADLLDEQLHTAYVSGRACDHGTETMTTCPTRLNEDFAYWLGVLIGDGSMTDIGRHITIVNADQELLDTWQRSGERLFGMAAERRVEPTKTRVFFYSMTLQRWLHNHLDIKIGYAAPIEEVPALILRSPRSVVAAFLRGLFDADGCAAKTNGGQVIYVSRSKKLAQTVQHLLLKFGVICRTRQQKDQCYRLMISGQDAAIFAHNVGFGLSRKQDRLDATIAAVSRRRPRRTMTRVIAKEEDVGITYDFSVDETHRYTAGAFVHHNCATYTHYRIMNRLHDKGLMTDGSMIEFLASHTNVVCQPEFDDPRYSGINPYALGFAMMRDIERMCWEPTAEDRKEFPDFAGCRDEMTVLKDAWENYRDESFIRQFLSPKVIRDLSLFQLKDNRKDPSYVVTAIHNERGYAQIRETLADSYERHQNVPQMEVVRVDPQSRTLVLEYRQHQKRTLANVGTMAKHIQTLWGHPVMIYDDKQNTLA